jgi:phosphate transport system permease protein
LSASLFAPGSTIASKIAGEFGEASDSLFLGSLMELALVLLVINILINIMARWLVWRLSAVKVDSL